MNDDSFIKQKLSMQGLPIHEADIPHIYNILSTINHASSSLHLFPQLNKKVPITIVDKRLMQ
ncbi:hypothetical protein [Lederbergia graminis]|uniref:Uncharacterized protein n=1 Tax=Lederbergia graminis TaxID=735518 RepID=A0ABW0LIP0_9BACI|nr:hypothetical protein [Paenibacillus bovis]